MKPFITIVSLAVLHASIVLGSSFAVPTIFQVFYDNHRSEDGNIRANVITQQIEVLNSFTKQIGLSFNISATLRMGTGYSNLHNWNDSSVEFFTRNRQGNEQTLNIYTVGKSLQGGGSFVSSYPWDYQNSPQRDGIVIDYDFLPGGRNEGFNTGKVLVQAVGHWAGLFSTYEGGCSGAGDYVDDTPPEASPAEGCPVGRDTCPGAGPDPIHNIMDGTSDECRTHLTAGQYRRMTNFLRQYRGINVM